jgi:hypothetical protein
VDDAGDPRVAVVGSGPLDRQGPPERHAYGEHAQDSRGENEEETCGMKARA